MPRATAAPGELCLATILLATSALGQESGASRPRARALRIPKEEAPRIDGDLSDPVWSKAPEIGPFTQVEPVEGMSPTERTVVRIAYDERRLYIGVWCYDSDPSGIVATQMRRDAELDSDDRIEIVLDTFHDRRNAYFFQLGAGGSIGDALVTNNGSDFNKSWDGIWEGAVRRSPEGWFAEAAIPFRTLAFGREPSTWGLNLERIIKRKWEEDRWAGARQNLSLFRIAEAGDLEGLEGLRQGIGLDLVPYVRGEANRTRDPLDRDLVLSYGGDLFYRLTPGITGTLTAHTDFAETEVDERQVNLTRFPLFFPEKRRFFLEDAGIFAFEAGGARGPGASRDFVPFFSRRIGIDPEGNPVPILAGAKVTGREGPWSLGFLGVETGAKHDLEGESLFAARVRRNLGERSILGILATRGNPESGPDNSLLGFDYKYTTTAFAGDRNLDVTLYALQSWTEGIAGDDLAYGVDVSYPNDVWQARLAARVVQEDFHPALGFVQRPGTRRFTGDFSWNPRPHTTVRQLEFGIAPDVFTDASGRVETALLRITPFKIEMESGDEAAIQVTPQYERLEEAFEILPGLVVPEGSHDFLRARLRIESASKRVLSGMLEVGAGDFFNGRRTDLEGSLDYRPGGRFNASVEVEQNRVEMPVGVGAAFPPPAVGGGGDFTVRLARLRTEVNFSPSLSWQNFVQFDNVSETAGLNSRVRWILRPGNDLFFVVNQGWERVSSGSALPVATEAVAKLVTTLRF